MVRQLPGTDFWGEPLATLRRIQEEINRTIAEPRAGVGSDYPPVNVWRGENGVIVTAEIPGVLLESLELTVHQNALTIKGNREPPVKAGEVNFHRRERAFGPFARSIVLPFAVDSERVQAATENGILKVHLPRPEADKPRKITITKL